MNLNSLNLGASSATNANLTSPYNSNNVTPTNASNIIQDLNPNRISNENFGSNYPDFTNMISVSSNKNEEDVDTDDNDVTLEEKMLNDVERLIYSNNSNSNSNSDFDKFSSSKANNSHSLPQLPVYTFSNCFKNCASRTMSEQEQTSGEANIFDNQSTESLRSIHSASASSMSSYQKQNKKENKESQKRKIAGLFNDFKLNPYNFHSLETFGRFIRYSLNLKSELVKEIISNPRIQYWIDKNRCHGFVYQTYPRNCDKKVDETKRRVPPVRCELCKFYGHLSHTCSIKELAFKLNNVVLKNGACRCHICGQLGHPAEAGLCPYIACSFCHQNGHWNYMCPNKDNISRTQCFKCQRYGHSTERCPDHWRQFDRISTFEQTPYKDASETQKPVYCYQCAQKGHYGYNCPDFHRKYFIRDYHQLDTYPVYFFASSSPFIKYSVKFNENDKRIVNYLVNKPIDDRFSNKSVEEDPLEQLEKFQAKVRNENILNMSIFDETHTNMPLKEYIRKWSNWVIDFHWIFTLKYFIEFLPTNKLHFFIKNYPSLDNFILHWMWWSYSLNKDLERFTKDPFRAIGSMPWLTYDVCERNLDKINEHAAETNVKKENELKTEIKNLTSKVPKQPSKFFQYNEFTIKTIGSLLFQEEANSYKLNNVDKALNQKKLPRSHSYSDQILQSIVDLTKQSDHHHHQTAQLDQHLDELGSFKETCEYLRMQKNEMTLKMENLSPESLNQHKMRSKSLSSTNDVVQTLKGEENIKTENDNAFNDELDKTIVYFDIGCCDKDDLERSQSKNESKLDEENQLKKFIEDKLNVKIEKTATSTNEEPLACSSEPSVFDKFFKSFSSQEEIKKQNEDNLNRIIDLLNKTNVVKKSESLVTTTTIIPSADEQHEDTKSQQPEEDIDTQIKILLKIDIPTSSSSSSSSSTPDENKLELQKEQLKCPNNSKSSDQYASAVSSSSNSSSSSVSPLLSVTSTSLDDNKTLSNKKENLLSMSVSSKSSPCISINKTHKHKHEHKLNKISPVNKFRQMNSHRHHFNSASKSYSSLSVNKHRESENGLVKSKFKKPNETTRNFTQNNFRQFQHQPQQQQQNHQMQQNMPINFGFELNKQWSINLNPQEQLNQQHIVNMSAENRNNNNNRNYYQPFMVSNNQFQQVKPQVNSIRHSWSDRQRDISTESFSTEFSMSSSAQASSFQRNNNLNNANFNQFNSKIQRANNNTSSFSNSQARLMTNQTSRNESKPKNYHPNYNYVGNFKENIENRNSSSQMNYNGFNRQQNMIKNEQSVSSSSSSAASSLNLPSYMNMMPLSNILNNSSKENQLKPNSGNNNNGLLQLKQPDNKMNNRNRFNQNNNMRNQNTNLDNFKKQENDEMKYKYQQNSNNTQGAMINNSNNSINNNRSQYSSMPHMIHSSTYHALGSAFNNSSNKMIASSSYSPDPLNQVTNLASSQNSTTTQQAYAQAAPLQAYNMNRNENVFNNYSTTNRTNLKKIPNESLLNQKQLVSSSSTAFEANAPMNINQHQQQQKRAKIFYNKK